MVPSLAHRCSVRYRSPASRAASNSSRFLLERARARQLVVVVGQHRRDRLARDANLNVRRDLDADLLVVHDRGRCRGRRRQHFLTGSEVLEDAPLLS